MRKPVTKEWLKLNWNDSLPDDMNSQKINIPISYFKINNVFKGTQKLSNVQFAMASVEKVERNVMKFFYIFNYNCNYFNIKNIYALKFLYFSSQNISKFAKHYFKTHITIII